MVGDGPSGPGCRVTGDQRLVPSGVESLSKPVGNRPQENFTLHLAQQAPEAIRTDLAETASSASPRTFGNNSCSSSIDETAQNEDVTSLEARSTPSFS